MAAAHGWRFRFGAMFLALMMAVVSAAVCYAGTISQQSEQSCANMGGHRSDEMPPGNSSHGSHGDCCDVQPVNMAPVAVLPAVAPATDWVYIQPPSIVIDTQIGFAGSSFDSSSPPTYLLVSTFRI